MESKKKIKLNKQLKKRKLIKTKNHQEYEGNTELMLSTGSTLLDLAICGTRIRGGGIPAGILLEAFGPEGSGKTVLLSELGGDVQRKGGENIFNDPEARLNKKFASIFGLAINDVDIRKPKYVSQIISSVRDFAPKNENVINAILTDSLTALTTEFEMKNKDGDKMGMRRSKELSTGFRKICRILPEKNFVMACSNQIRINVGASTFSEQFTVPGGKAVGFYASTRLRFFKPEKLFYKKVIGKKEVKWAYGTKVKINVYKNSCDVPYRDAEIYIVFDYGIDDVRANLIFIKEHTKNTVYQIGKKVLDKNLEKSIQMVEKDNLENKLKNTVIDLWEDINDRFKVERKKKKR